MDKLGPSLARMAEEDPTLHMEKNAETGDMLMSGMGESHIDIAAERMKRKFGVDVAIDVPKVAYRETITAVRRRPRGATRSRRAATACSATPGSRWSRCRRGVRLRGQDGGRLGAQELHSRGGEGRAGGDAGGRPGRVPRVRGEGRS